MKRVAATTVILSAIALLARAQSAAISGRVVADESGDPIPNARVTLATAAPALGTPVVLTDGDGRFTFTAPPGRQTVVAGKSGYARSEPMPATAGQSIEIRLPRGAVISGRVVDTFGDPVVGARVVAEVASSTGTNPTVVANADTDDRGEYRLGSLPPGTFALAVTTIDTTARQVVIDNRMTIVGPVPQKMYYPGAATASEAQTLHLQARDERRGIDFVVAADQNGGNPFSVARLVGPLAAPDTSAGASGVVRGRVVSTDGRSLSYAQVSLIPRNDFRGQHRTTADGDGRFEFTGVPAGKFQVVASKTGYSPDGGDQPLLLSSVVNSGRTLDLADGEIRERVDITLRRWGSLAGRISDELGDPVQAASVQVLHVRYEAGRRRLVAGGAARVTDDLGRYRVYALAPGRYVVSATVGGVASADLPGYTRSYFPGTSNAGDAQFVSVSASQDVVGIDFSLSRARTAHITGKMLSAAGEPTTGGTVQLMPSQRSTSVTSVPTGARILPDGRFEFASVPPGTYIIQAYRGRSNSSIEGEFGAIPVSVNGMDVTDLVLQMSFGSSIKGRITFDTYNGSKAPPRSAIELSPIPIDFDLSPQNNLAIAEIHDDWSFDIAGVNGPRRLQLTRVPPGWTLKEILVRRLDATDRPLPFGRKDQSLTDVEVVLTDRLTELSGTIADDRARPAPGASLIVFSMDRDRWYPSSRFLRTTVAGSDGAFTLSGLPLGSYYAAALAQLPSEGEDAWQDPAFLESLRSRATTVTLGDAQKISLSLRLTPR